MLAVRHFWLSRLMEPTSTMHINKFIRKKLRVYLLALSFHCPPFSLHQVLLLCYTGFNLHQHWAGLTAAHILTSKRVALEKCRMSEVPIALCICKVSQNLCRNGYPNSWWIRMSTQNLETYKSRTIWGAMWEDTTSFISHFSQSLIHLEMETQWNMSALYAG